MNPAPQKIHSSLGTYFVVLVAGIMALAMLVTTFIQYRADIVSDTETHAAQAEALSNMLAEISIVPILSYDFVSLDDLTRDAGTQKHVAYAVVQSAENKILTQYISSSSPTGEAAELAALLSDGNLIHRRTPIIFEGAPLGYTLIGLDKVHIEKMAMTHLLNQFILSGVTAGISGLFLIAVFRRKILLRLQYLIEGAERISQFEFDYELDSRGNDELSALAKMFNTMTKELKSAIEERDAAIQEVKLQNLTLEERVAERSKELQGLNRALSYQALHDPLTGLPNRVLVLDRLQTAILRAKRSKKNAAIFMLDLDKFKDINDTLGHPIGDRLLQVIGRRLKSAVREEDTIGRLGGDEFAVVLPDTDIHKVQIVAKKLLGIFGTEFILDNYKLSISASLGIAMYPEHGEDQATLLKKSDVAMYMAKKREDKIALYDPEKDQYSPERLHMITELRGAIEDKLLGVAYQPIIDIKTGMVDSLEALARWRYLKQDISPEEFIPMAEESGLGQQLAKIMIGKVINQAAQWSERNIELPISVNLSIRNIDELDLPSLIGGHLERTGLNAEMLKIEITESELMANPEYLMSLIQHPALKGVQYSIDDFGTGYSSLSYLKKLSVHQVKIDRSFITEIDKNDEDYAISKAIIDLTHSLGLEVVAEGVETEPALKILMGLGCDYAQGYLFSRPLPEEKILPAILEINKRTNLMISHYKQRLA